MTTRDELFAETRRALKAQLEGWGLQVSYRLDDFRVFRVEINGRDVGSINVEGEPEGEGHDQPVLVITPHEDLKRTHRAPIRRYLAPFNLSLATGAFLKWHRNIPATNKPSNRGHSL